MTRVLSSAELTNKCMRVQLETDQQCCAGFEGLYRAWQPCGRSMEWYSTSARWKMCAGTYPTTRGFTCSLWSLFHMLLAQTTDGHASADITTIHDWILNYFGCDDCRQHFYSLSQQLGKSVHSQADAMLWLWQAHNSVNLRLRQEQR
jgi:thiol oxidase